MNFVAYDVEYDAAVSEGQGAHLRLELGWTEVRRGLGLIIRGYVISILAIGSAVGVAVTLLMMDPKERAKIPWQVRDAGLFLGLAALAMVLLYAYGCVIVGKWRCLMNAPERRGAKWLMFACLTCILAGPALNWSANLTGIKKQPKLERGLEGIKEVQLTTEGAVLQVGSAGVQLLGNVLFLLFLRAVASCFDDRSRVALVDFYLGFLAILVVATIGLAFAGHDWGVLAIYGGLLALGWLAGAIGYLLIIAAMRGSIRRGLARLTSPINPLMATSTRP